MFRLVVVAALNRLSKPTIVFVSRCRMDSQFMSLLYDNSAI